MTGYMQFPGLLRHGLQVCAGPAAASSRITQLVSAAFTFIEMSGIKSRTSHHFTSFTPSHAHRYKDLICVQPVFSIDTLHSMAELMKSVPPSTQTSKSHRRHPGTNRGQMTVGFHVDWTPSTWSRPSVKSDVAVTETVYRSMHVPGMLLLKPIRAPFGPNGSPTLRVASGFGRETANHPAGRPVILNPAPVKPHSGGIPSVSALT